MNDLTRAFLANTRTVAREQIEHIFEERMAALTAGVERAVEESIREAQRELAGKLNQAVRRLRCLEGEQQWSKVLVDATQGFCDRAALFTLNGRVLQLQAARNFGEAAQLTDVALSSAPAFASAAESKDTVVAIRTRGEMSEPIAAWIGEAADQKFHLFPIVTGGRVTAVLYADASDRNVEVDAVELLATVAGAVIARRESIPEPSVGPEPHVDLVNIAVASQGPDVAPAPFVDRDQQYLHSKAQRFARVQTAEIRLYKSEEVKKGRTERDLYTSLKVEIDAAREVFHRDFLSTSGTMVDYLHLELVRTLANNDAELLGPNYPGPLV